mgnify:CR=1 FL=1
MVCIDFYIFNFKRTKEHAKDTGLDPDLDMDPAWDPEHDPEPRAEVNKIRGQGTFGMWARSFT